MKKLLLVLCLIASMMCFGACSSENSVGYEVDATTKETITKAAQAAWEDTFLANMDKESIQAEYDLFVEDENDTWANAMLAWDNTLGDLGAYVKEVSVEVVKNEDKTFTCIMVQEFAERNLTVELTVDKEVSYWQGVALNADYTFGEKMVKAGMNTAIGMAVVFVVLIFIALVISLFKYIPAIQAKFADRGKKSAAPVAAPVPKAAQAPKAEPAAAPAPAQNLMSDLELVAVITAAIAASENIPADGLVVRSIKRKKTAGWRRA